MHTHSFLHALLHIQKQGYAEAILTTARDNGLLTKMEDIIRRKENQEARSLFIDAAWLHKRLLMMPWRTKEAWTLCINAVYLHQKLNIKLFKHQAVVDIPSIHEQILCLFVFRCMLC